MGIKVSDEAERGFQISTFFKETDPNWTPGGVPPKWVQLGVARLAATNATFYFGTTTWNTRHYSIYLQKSFFVLALLMLASGIVLFYLLSKRRDRVGFALVPSDSADTEQDSVARLYIVEAERGSGRTTDS